MVIGNSSFFTTQASKLIKYVLIANRISPEDSGFSSFFIATLFLVASFISFVWMTKVPFYRYDLRAITQSA